MSVRLGYERVSSPGAVKEVQLTPEALRRHACIFGASGTGKSNCAMVLASGLGALSVPVVILDRTGEYAGSLIDARVVRAGENLRMAPFSLDKRPVEVQIEDWVSLLSHFCRVSHGSELSPLQARVLREAFSKYYQGTKATLTISALIERLQTVARQNSKVKGWPESIEALVSRLYPMVVGGVGRAVDSHFDELSVDSLFCPGVTVVDLSPLIDDNARNLLSQVLLKRVYEAVRKRGISQKLEILLVIDEAQHLAPSDDRYLSIPERCAVELRKYGLSLVMVATRPTLVSANVVANCGTLVSFGLTSYRDIRTLSDYLACGPDNPGMTDSIRTLEVGFAVVQFNVPKPRSPLFCHVLPAEMTAAVARPSRQSSTG